MFEKIIELSSGLYQTMSFLGEALFSFFGSTLNDLTGLDIDNAIMDMNMLTIMLGGGLVTFLTFKVIKFVVGTFT